MAPRITATVLVLALAGCETAKVVRPDLRPVDPVAVVVLPAKPSPPDSGLMLVNPLECLEALRGGDTSWFGVIVGLLCFPVLGTVDLVALPWMVAAQGEAKAASRAWTCSSTSPAERAAEVLVDGLVNGHGMVRAGEPGSESPSATTFRLEVGKRAEGSKEVACNGAEADVTLLGDLCARRWLDALSTPGVPRTAQRG